MAVIKLSGLVSGIRGKFNGSQISVTGGGLVLQNKCKQKRIGSASQYNWRQNFKLQANNWKLLSSEEVAENNANALNYPYTDKFGDTKYYTGYQLLLRSNLNLITSGLPSISVVPETPPESGSYSSTDFIPYITGSGQPRIEVYWSASSSIVSSSVTQIFISPPVSDGVTNFTGKWVLLGVTDSIEEFFSLNGSLIPFNESWLEGSKIFIALKAVDNASGVEVANAVFYSNVQQF